MLKYYLLTLKYVEEVRAPLLFTIEFLGHGVMPWHTEGAQ